MKSELSAAARALRALHHASEPLLLANAWDVRSARASVDAGLHAVATSSSGVAAALGYGDGEDMPIDEVFAAVTRITRVVDLPVTADLEAGYGLSAAELVERLLAAGAVGLNLEDSDPRTGKLRELATQAGRLAEVREAATLAGVEIVINARIDVIVQGTRTGPVPFEELLARGRAYLDAGADCVYPILLADEEALGGLVRELRAPVNALLMGSGPDLRRLGELGLARVSVGGGLAHSAFGFVADAIARLRAGDPAWSSPAG